MDVSFSFLSLPRSQTMIDYYNKNWHDSEWNHQLVTINFIVKMKTFFSNRVFFNHLNSVALALYKFNIRFVIQNWVLLVSNDFITVNCHFQVVQLGFINVSHSVPFFDTISFSIILTEPPSHSSPKWPGKEKYPPSTCAALEIKKIVDCLLSLSRSI